LRHFRLARACQEALAWSKILRLPIYRVLWQAVGAALPATLAPAALYAGTDGSYTVNSTETSLVPGLIDRMNLSESGNVFSDDWLQAAHDRRKYFRALSTMLELRILQPPELWQHLDYTHPFAHRPLVEFLMTVPVDVLCRPGEPRRLMRSSLSHLWPVELQRRRSKALFNLPWQEALRPLAGVLTKSKELHLVEHGFVDRSSLLSRLHRLSAGLDCNQDQLRYIVVLELWLRQRADRKLSRECLQAV